MSTTRASIMWFGVRSIGAKSWVTGNGLDERLKQILTAVCEEHQAEVMSMEIMPDHVHLLGESDPQLGIHRLVRLLKGRSSRL